MNPTVCKSKDPCVICGNHDRDVEIDSKQPRLVATFCNEHAYDRLPEQKPPKVKAKKKKGEGKKESEQE